MGQICTTRKKTPNISFDLSSKNSFFEEEEETNSIEELDMITNVPIHQPQLFKNLSDHNDFTDTLIQFAEAGNDVLEPPQQPLPVYIEITRPPNMSIPRVKSARKECYEESRDCETELLSLNSQDKNYRFVPNSLQTSPIEELDESVPVTYITTESNTLPEQLTSEPAQRTFITRSVATDIYEESYTKIKLPSTAVSDTFSEQRQSEPKTDIVGKCLITRSIAIEVDEESDTQIKPSQTLYINAETNTLSEQRNSEPKTDIAGKCRITRSIAIEVNEESDTQIKSLPTSYINPNSDTLPEQRISELEVVIAERSLISQSITSEIDEESDTQIIPPQTLEQRSLEPEKSLIRRSISSEVDEESDTQIKSLPTSYINPNSDTTEKSLVKQLIRSKVDGESDTQIKPPPSIESFEIKYLLALESQTTTVPRAILLEPEQEVYTQYTQCKRLLQESTLQQIEWRSSELLGQSTPLDSSKQSFQQLSYPYQLRSKDVATMKKLEIATNRKYTQTIQPSKLLQVPSTYRPILQETKGTSTHVTQQLQVQTDGQLPKVPRGTKIMVQKKLPELKIQRPWYQSSKKSVAMTPFCEFSKPVPTQNKIVKRSLYELPHTSSLSRRMAKEPSEDELFTEIFVDQDDAHRDLNKIVQVPSRFTQSTRKLEDPSKKIVKLMEMKYHKKFITAWQLMQKPPKDFIMFMTGGQLPQSTKIDNCAELDYLEFLKSMRSGV